MREITIHILGKPASGKTTAAALIAMALRGIGCEVTTEILSASRGKAMNLDIDNIDQSVCEPMRVHIKEHAL